MMGRVLILCLVLILMAGPPGRAQEEFPAVEEEGSFSEIVDSPSIDDAPTEQRDPPVSATPMTPTSTSEPPPLLDGGPATPVPPPPAASTVTATRVPSTPTSAGIPAVPPTSPPTPVPTATSTPPPTSTATPKPTATKVPSAPSVADRDCSDFATWRAAQDFYLAAGGPARDPHGLDGNRNGIACESLPGAP